MCVCVCVCMHMYSYTYKLGKKGLDLKQFTISQIYLTTRPLFPQTAHPHKTLLERLTWV